MFGNQNIHFWEGLFSKCFFTSFSCFWIFGILECIFLLFLLFSFENFDPKDSRPKENPEIQTLSTCLQWTKLNL